MKVGIPDGTNGTMVKNHVSITKFTEQMILGQQTNNLIVVEISGCIKNLTYFPTNDSTSRPFRVLVAGSRVSETGDRSHESVCWAVGQLIGDPDPVGMPLAVTSALCGRGMLSVILGWMQRACQQLRRLPPARRNLPLHELQSNCNK